MVIQYVKIGDEGDYKTHDEYEDKVFKAEYKGFNLIYGNVKTGEMYYHSHNDVGD